MTFKGEKLKEWKGEKMTFKGEKVTFKSEKVKEWKGEKMAAPTNLSTRQLVNLFSHQLDFVSFLVKFLTLWVPFLSTSRSPSRKKSILARVYFDAKRGWL